MKSSFDSMIRPSPGTPSPALSTTMSPGTTSSKGTSISRPSRMTIAFNCTSAIRSSTAFDASYSCQNPSAPLKITITMMMIESVGSPRKKDSTAANSRMRMIGLVNWLKNSLTAFTSRLGLSRFGPNFFRRSLASPEESPCSSVPQRRKRSGSGTDQKGCSAAGGPVVFIIGIFHPFAHKGMACP